jgi:hypothetical protein
MTQFYASWALVILGWLAFTTRAFIRDNTKAIAVERAAGLGRNGR